MVPTRGEVPVIMTLLEAARAFPSIFDSVAAATEPQPTAEAEAEVRPSGFAGFGLPASLVRTLVDGGIATPFPIQAATIPDALAGRDVLGRGKTGSGKTLAFGLPLLARIAASGRSAPHRPKGLVLVPTRELAMQVNDALTPLAKSLGLFTKTAFGGAPYQTQIFALERGVDVLVATPGRLADLIERGVCSLAAVEISVLDEADQMADLGFLPDVTALLAQTPAGAQRLLFSATLDNDVDALVTQFMRDPVTHETDPPVAAVDTMEHHALLVPPRDKFEVLAAIANRIGRTIMFVQTQAAVDRLVEQFAEVGVRAAALHGGKNQRVRTRTLAEFREGRFDALVATNVAARGIHVDGVTLVVHVDPPRDAKDYLHRAGRTARAGESGSVVTLVLPRQRRSTFTMMERAGVDPVRTPVDAAAPALAELTGARRPSGVPVQVHQPAPPAPRNRGPRPGRGPAGPRAWRHGGRAPVDRGTGTHR
jgi:superfamily II DNA/RNA helicase